MKLMNLIIATHMLPSSPLITAPCEHTAATTMLDVSHFIQVLLLLQSFLHTGKLQL